MTIPELIKKIEQWAIDRGLDKNGTVEGQLIKTAEEVAELIIGISKDNIDVIKDSVGDVFVTLVVGNLLGYNHEFYNICYKNAYVYPRDFGKITRKVELISTLITYLKNILADGLYIGNYVELMIAGLIWVCVYYDLELVDCIESAYNEIAHRKGKVVNGSFVKESDL